MKQALIIFVRKPEKGKVKTRIAAVVGHEAALIIYKKLLQHTYDITHPLACDKYVFYAEAIETNDMWSNGYYKLLQANADLGSRMEAAFSQLFRKDYQCICIIGSDCYELTSTHIEQTFRLLSDHQIVLGTAHDGGYYLLAMKDGVKDIFQNIDWSTKHVLRQTLEQIQKHHYSCTLLPTLNDVDTVNDVPEGWLIG